MTVREEIEQLKKEKDAVILAHYYVPPEVRGLRHGAYGGRGDDPPHERAV